MKAKRLLCKHKLAVAIILSVILFIPILWTSSLNLEAQTKGDVNSDGKIDIADSIKALRMATNQDPPDPSRADINNDTQVTVEDANLILEMALSKITPPPDPGTVAPPLNPTVATTINTATQFLYTGDSPIQTGVVPGTIDPRRTAVIRGKVLTRDGLPLEAVTITILNHPEFGRTLTRTDGMLDMVVNGSKANPAMQAFGAQLNDLDLAAVVTYQRNAFGNNMGDSVQAVDVYNFKKGQ